VCKTRFTCSGIENCTEIDWWDEREVVLNPNDLNGGKVSAKLGLLPCQHTSGRGLTDRSMTLWGSWSVESGGKKVYFAGCVQKFPFFTVFGVRFPEVAGDLL
jgi:L-ascorbate metabolism protein UlaG (beta-lactamase superfamily)